MMGKKEMGGSAASPGERSSPAVPAVWPRLVRGAVRGAVRVGSGFLGLGLAGVQVLFEPGQSLVGDNEAGGDEGLGESDDALAAGVAAGVRGGPVLLTEPDRLPAPSATELQRLDPDEIVVVGGTGSVSDAVVRELT